MNEAQRNEKTIMEMMEESMALIKALAPEEAPDDCLIVKGQSGLNIMKNDMLPGNTIIVSKRLFDLIYAAGSESANE